MFRARYFQHAIEEDDISVAIKKLKQILDLADNENGWDDISSDDEGDELATENDEYVVEKVLEEGVVKGRHKFLVKWVGFEDPKDQTWEPLDHFTSKGSKMAIFLFYKKKWKKELKNSKKDQSNAKTSSDTVELKINKEKLKQSNDKELCMENVPPQGKSTSKSGEHVPQQNNSDDYRNSRASTSSASKVIAKPARYVPLGRKIHPSVASKLAERRFKSAYAGDDSGIYFQKDELIMRREMQQKQLRERKELEQKKLEEKRQAEIRARQKAEIEKKKASEKAKELQMRECYAKVRADLWGSSDDDDDENTIQQNVE